MLTNSYATLAEYKAYVTARGQTSSTDTTDDGVIESLLNSASRLIDQQTRRQFYPRIETRHYDIPVDRRLFLNDDLLSLTTLTNGDDTVISASDYTFEDYNYPPYYAVKLNRVVSVVWTVDGNGNDENVIDVLGEWGYHNEYGQRAWVAVGTLAAAMSDTTTLTMTLTAGHSVVTGGIYKIGSEILQGSIATNIFTAYKRGDNGSTAATHLINSVIYRWYPMSMIVDFTLQIANNAYKRRFGEGQASATVTAAGVVLGTTDIPADVMRSLRDFRSLT